MNIYGVKFLIISHNHKNNYLIFAANKRNLNIGNSQQYAIMPRATFFNFNVSVALLHHKLSWENNKHKNMKSYKSYK